MSRETKIIALTGKGGVGKTSISAALVKLLVEEFPEERSLPLMQIRRLVWLQHWELSPN